MGIQINGITDTISATDGGLAVSGQQLTGVTDINASGIVTATQGYVVGTGASVFSPAANTLALGTNGSERVRIDSSGNLGIGTNSPLAKLDVRGNMVLGYGVTTSITLLEKQFATAHSSSNRGGILRVGLTDGAFSGVEIDNGVGSNPAYNSQNVHLITHNGGVAGDIRALTARFDGNVGVGTTRPFVAFEVQNSTYPHIVSNYNNSKHLRMSVGGSGGGFAISEGHFLTIAHQPFADRATDSNLTERIRIDSSGRLLVGTASASSTNIDNLKFEVSSGNVKLGANLTIGRTGGDYDGIGYNVGWQASVGYKYVVSDTAAYIRFGSQSRIETFTAPASTGGNGITFTAGPYVAQGGTSWTSSSDERLKEDLQPIENALYKVENLRSVTGRFKTDPQEKRRTFLIAQDVKLVLPEAVDEANPDSLGLDYSAIIPLLVAALKESKERIEQLESAVAALQVP